MQQFVEEAGTTIGVIDSKTVTTYSAKLFKEGASNGWTTNTLPFNLTKGSYSIEVEVLETINGHIFIGIVDKMTLF